MKIKSSFKDYYDHQAHIYGGGDPRITYSRVPLTPGNIVGTAGIEVVEATSDTIALRCHFPHKWSEIIRSRWLIRDHDEEEDELSWLAIAGRLYLLVGTRERLSDPMNFSVLSENNPAHARLINKLTKRRVFYEKTYGVAELVGAMEPALLPISRTLRAPVFVISDIIYSATPRDRRRVLIVDRAIPILGRLGVPAVYSPAQIYQDIAYFMGNTVHESPDTHPPVNVSDRDRLIQHGFDMKISFRHRK